MVKKKVKKKVRQELVIKLADGKTIRCGPGVEYEWGGYIRVCDESGTELTKWKTRELKKAEQAAAIWGSIIRRYGVMQKRSRVDPKKKSSSNEHVLSLASGMTLRCGVKNVYFRFHDANGIQIIGWLVYDVESPEGWIGEIAKAAAMEPGELIATFERITVLRDFWVGAGPPSAEEA